MPMILLYMLLLNGFEQVSSASYTLPLLKSCKEIPAYVSYAGGWQLLPNRYLVYNCSLLSYIRLMNRSLLNTLVQSR